MNGMETWETRDLRVFDHDEENIPEGDTRKHDSSSTAYPRARACCPCDPSILDRIPHQKNRSKSLLTLQCLVIPFLGSRGVLRQGGRNPLQ